MLQKKYDKLAELGVHASALFGAVASTEATALDYEKPEDVFKVGQAINYFNNIPS
jgi:hypothetical protein